MLNKMRITVGKILLFLILVSCNSNAVYNKFTSIENENWDPKNSINFSFDNTDTISPKNVFINIRSTENYPFSSLFLIAKIELPNGLKVTDTLEYEMATPKGEWLGEGFFSIKENKLFLKEKIIFKEKGTYNFEIKNATRSIDDIKGEKPLLGIASVGLSIEKVLE